MYIVYVGQINEILIPNMILQLKRERFTEELESYAKLVEEFASYGEITDVPRYLKKAQALDAKLQAAADKVRRRLGHCQHLET